MIKTWTPEAEQALEDYLARVEALARQNGDDATEIIDGLRAHIYVETASRAPSPVVGLANVVGVLRALGTPEEVLGRPEGIPKAGNTPPEENAQHEAPAGCLNSIPYLVLLAIVLPAFSLFFEVVTGYMGAMYVDPIPSLWHVGAGILLLLSLTYAQLLQSGSMSTTGRRLRLALALNGFALLLGIVYALVYLYILPIAAIAILGFGLGLMGFSPLFCAIAAAVQCHRLQETARAMGIRPGTRLCLSLAGMLAAGAFLGIYHGHEKMQYLAVRDAVTTGSAESIARLNTPGGERLVRRLCQHPGLVGWTLQRRYLEGTEPTAEQLNRVYFQMTGLDVGMAPEALTFADRFGHRPEDDSMQRVLDGAPNPPTQEPTFLLKESLIDASLGSARDGDTAPVVAYVEWTMTFMNHDKWSPLEARARVQLPPGGVASRLTLWVNGTEQEAAVGTRHQTEQAYRQVAVVQRRDPALLVTDGPDLVRLNCFPVPPGGTMKVKVGITCPILYRDGKGYLRLPHFVNHNFDIPGDCAHQVWVEAKTPVPMPGEGFATETSADGTQTTRGKLADAALCDNGRGTVMVEQLPALPGEWQGQISGYGGTMRMSPRPVPVKAKLCLVVDGSAGMSRNTIDWDRALSALPQDTDVSVIFCGINEAETCPATDRAALAQWLKDRPYAGGCDPYPGLVKSLELLRDHENAVLLWVHAPLPVHFDSAQTLEQWALRRGDKNGSDMPKVLSLCTETGKDAALGPLEALPGFAPVPVFNGTQDTLQFTLRTLASEDVLREYSVAENGSTETRYGHVARLAVADAVNRLHAEKQNDAAAKMAAKCRLVTPASGAVVLETEKQYKDHGLNPGADPDSIPSVPEPSEWALIAVTLIALSALAWWRRKVRMSATGAQ